MGGVNASRRSEDWRERYPRSAFAERKLCRSVRASHPQRMGVAGLSELGGRMRGI